MPVFLHLSKRWILSNGRNGCPNNEIGYSVSFCHFPPVLSSVGYNKSLLEQHTLSLLIVSTVQHSQLMSPCIPHSLSKRKEFMTFWYCCFCCHVSGNGHNTDAHVVFWPCNFTVSPLCQAADISDKYVPLAMMFKSCFQEHLKWFCLVLFAFFVFQWDYFLYLCLTFSNIPRLRPSF